MFGNYLWDDFHYKGEAQENQGYYVHRSQWEGNSACCAGTRGQQQRVEGMYIKRRTREGHEISTLCEFPWEYEVRIRGLFIDLNNWRFVGREATFSWTQGTRHLNKIDLQNMEEWQKIGIDMLICIAEDVKFCQSEVCSPLSHWYACGHRMTSASRMIIRMAQNHLISFQTPLLFV